MRSDLESRKTEGKARQSLEITPVEAKISNRTFWEVTSCHPINGVKKLKEYIFVTFWLMQYKYKIKTYNAPYVTRVIRRRGDDTRLGSIGNDYVFVAPYWSFSGHQRDLMIRRMPRHLCMVCLHVMCAWNSRAALCICNTSIDYLLVALDGLICAKVPLGNYSVIYGICYCTKRFTCAQKLTDDQLNRLTEPNRK